VPRWATGRPTGSVTGRTMGCVTGRPTGSVTGYSRDGSHSPVKTGSALSRNAR